jgi:hypothetical protein
VKNLFIFFTDFYFLHRFYFVHDFFSLFFSVKKAFQKTKGTNFLNVALASRRHKVKLQIYSFSDCFSNVTAPGQISFDSAD